MPVFYKLSSNRHPSHSYPPAISYSRAIQTHNSLLSGIIVYLYLTTDRQTEEEKLRGRDVSAADQELWETSGIFRGFGWGR